MALDLIEALRRRKPEYVLLDAAQDPGILPVLAQNKAEWRSLYEGQSAVKLASHAPYIAAAAQSPEFLEEILTKGWGQSWCVFVCSDASLDEVRRHFRSLLYVKNSRGEQVYFRFYDPRILRAYLPTCNAGELEQFFGPVQQFIVEGEHEEEMYALALEAGKLASRKGTVSLPPPEEAL
jgi:hypothetical protein